MRDIVCVLKVRVVLVILEYTARVPGRGAGGPPAQRHTCTGGGHGPREGGRSVRAGARDDAKVAYD